MPRAESDLIWVARSCAGYPPSVPARKTSGYLPGVPARKTLGPLRLCAACDCDIEFHAVRSDQRYCSVTCRNRMSRWRRNAQPTTGRPLYAHTWRLDPAGLTELRERAIAELIHGAISGAPAGHLSNVAGLALAAQRRLARLA